MKQKVLPAILLAAMLIGRFPAGTGGDAISIMDFEVFGISEAGNLCAGKRYEYEDGRLRAHLFNNAYRLELSASGAQSVSYSTIAHDADDGLDLSTLKTALLF